MAATSNVKRLLQWLAALLVPLLPSAVRAMVLPEDRADLMYHRYVGGGVTVDGPAFLVRKGVGDRASLYADHYVDKVSSASIDVVTTASPYKEQRTENTFGVDLLFRESQLGLSHTKSEERDYLAETTSFKYLQETFGGMTVVTMGYAIGKDTVRSNLDSLFGDRVDRYTWRLGVSQVLTKTWLLNVDYEGITEVGYLNSPYRAARVLGTPVPERYPRERSSHALAVTSIKHVFSDSAFRLGYRYFTDNWQIDANTIEGVFSTYLGNDKRWLLDARLRQYSQTKASFYSDNFQEERNYMARDKELSTFTSQTLGATASTSMFEKRFGLKRASANFSYDRVRFTYSDFTDRNGKPYSFNANVYQLFFSAWY